MQLGLYKLDAVEAGSSSIFYPSQFYPSCAFSQYAIDIFRHPARLVDLRRGECERAYLNRSGTDFRLSESTLVLLLLRMQLAVTWRRPSVATLGGSTPPERKRDDYHV